MASSIYAYYRYAGLVRQYFGTIIMIIGTIGNLLCIAVFSTSKSLRGNSAGVYFLALAVADTIVLYSGLPLELYDAFNHVSVAGSNTLVCQVSLFFMRGSADCAVWILLSATVDRFIAVRFPLKARSLCTEGRARVACVVLALLAIAKNSHVFYSRATVETTTADNQTDVQYCGYPNEVAAVWNEHISPWFSLVVYAFLPMAAMFFMNVVIIRTLLAMIRFVPGEETVESKEAAAERRNKVIPMTVMLLTVSVAFFVLVTPNITILCMRPWLSGTVTGHAVFVLAVTIGGCFAYLNHAINFYLYCVTGAKFRTELLKMFCGRGKGMEGSKVTTSVSTVSSGTRQ